MVYVHDGGGGKKKQRSRSKGMSTAEQQDAASQVAAQMQALLSGQPMMPYVAPDIHIKASGGPRNSSGARPLPEGNNTNYGAGNGDHPSPSATESGNGTGRGGKRGPSPVDQLRASLFDAIQSAAATPSTASYSASDIKQLLGSANNMGAPMTAQIKTIRNMNQGARNDTNKATKRVDAMYRALAQSDASAGQQAQEVQKQLADQITQMAATGNASNQQHVQELMGDNAKYGGDIAAQLNTDIAKTATTGQAANTQQAANFASAALSEGAANRQYFNANKSADLLEGANRSSDLISQLQSYLQGNRDKIGELVGQRKAATTSARASILSQIQGQQDEAQKAQYAAKQDAIGNMSDMLGQLITQGNNRADNQRQDAELSLKQQIAANNAALAQQKMSTSGTLGYDELVKILGSSGAFKGMSVQDIMAQLASLKAGQ